jgi:hypothetical protein
MIKKLSKVLPLAVVASLVAFQLLSPALSGWAAPPALPVCGHNVVTGSVDSGPPDMATSADEDYTAVVWAEDGSEGTPHAGYGAIKLAYSRAMTTTRHWTVLDVDTGTNNREPSIVFDPVSSNVVHIAYQQGIYAGSSVIYYAKCTLGGSCNTERASTGATPNTLRTNAKIATNASGEPVIVYQESQSAGSPRSWMSYAFKPSGESFKSVPNQLGDVAAELNPTVAAAGDVVHIAYAQDNDDNPDNGVSNKIKYLQLDASDMSGGTLPATSVPARVFEPNTTHVKTPNYPAIDVKGSTVALVWQFTNVGSSTQFNLAYNTSADNGATWYEPHAGNQDYRYIPSNEPSTIATLGSTDTRSNASGSVFMSDLHPDVTLHVSDIHIAWHEQVTEDSQTRTEVMHSYFDGALWQATSVYSSSLAQANVVSMTHVTFLYKYDVAAFDNDNVGRPKIFYGSPGNRLQVVYLAQNASSSILKVRYNGWQSGDSSASDPTLKFLDADCDTYSNDTEYPVPRPPDPPATCTGDFNGDGVLDCDGDDLPDYLDINSDNDFQYDDVDGNRYEFSNDGGVFLPIILKSS